MNIVIVIDSVDSMTNGSQVTAKRFAEGLKLRGHSVKLVAIGAVGENDCGLKERYVPVLCEVARKNDARFAKFDKKKIARAFSGADVIHFIFPFKLEKKCKKLADKMNIPTTAAFHVQPENVSYNIRLGKFKKVNDFIYRWLNRTFYRRFNRIHCPSQFIAGQLESHGYGGKKYVISNGFDPDFVPPKYPPENVKFGIITVGRLAPEKRQDVIISAIAASKYRQNITLTICGGGAKRKSLEKLAAKLNVDCEFLFLSKEKLIKKLQQSDLYVHAAEVEIEAIACVEAIACGLVPVIADSPLSATPQFALDLRSLFPAGDAAALKDKIEYWYEHAAERTAQGKRYAEHAQNYSLQKSLALAEEMFKDEISAVRGNCPADMPL